MIRTITYSPAFSADSSAFTSGASEVSFLEEDLLLLLVVFLASDFALYSSLKSTNSIIAVSAPSPSLNPVLMI